jgi:hypothetical protein
MGVVLVERASRRAVAVPGRERGRVYGKTARGGDTPERLY